jgi:two-component system CheB/CheR fusion protein
VAVRARAAGRAGHDILVVVGSSAGGIEALSTLMGGLDATLPAAVVVAQHLDPARRSHLQEILQRKASMPVVLIEGRTPLLPGKVYVVPSGSNVVVTPGAVELRPNGDTRSHPSVDLLLTSAARAYADHLFAVVLTGNGSDGANGAVAVKQAGGTVIIQDPRSAAHPSMPRALPPTAVDHVADVEQIGALVSDLVARAAANRDRKDTVDEHLTAVIDIIGRRAGIDFGPYKTSTVLRRVERRMVAVQASSIEAYARYLAATPEESGILVKALLIKVTEFFRDPDAFQYIRESVLPQIVERAGSSDRRLRFWSAGCATGEEAYSLAMVVADVVGANLADWSIRVFATDLDQGAVEFARRGVYPAAMLANVPDEYRGRFFEPLDSNSFRVTKVLRQMVIYGQQDLSRGVPFPRIDLLVCRNLLIYFQPELQAELLDHFAYSLSETGGYLFLGKAETARPSTASFELVNKKWKIYRCLSGPVATAFRAPGSGTLRGLRGGVAAVTPADAAAGSAPRALEEAIVRTMQAGTVVVDRLYRTVAMNSAARRLLGVREHGSERDFLHSVRGIPYGDVRAAIDTALRDRKPVVLPDVSLGLGDSAEPRYVNLTIAPVGEGPAADHLVITVVDATDAVLTRRRLEAAEDTQKRLVEELTATNARLNEANKDLLDANEELQAANEELMLAQEELQATNEEFEATNEELQATNEELETNNEELQATNEELDTTNDELHARTSELQEAAGALTRERQRLAEIMQKAAVPVLVLRGSALVVESASAFFASLAGNSATPGQPLEVALATLPDVARGVREALENDSPWISEAHRAAAAGSAPGTARTYLFTAVPLRDGGRPAGVALYAHDVTSLRG